ncbi:MAG: rhodanese-like domain-containing protein [Pseudomonadota bacterium]|nr:rhodanese-like domain-containing protein [Pseudomonadota bacterium]
MRIRHLSAGILAAALAAGLPTTTWAGDKADKATFEKSLTAAEEARKKAASAGGEWRDTGKIIKKAKAAAKEGDYAKAVKLADKAKRQGELGYEQAMDQKDAGMPAYMMAGGEPKKVAGTSAENKITAELESVEVMHNGEKVVVMRGHDKAATLPEEFLKTDRGCPPFCVQPLTVAEGVETVGELEVLDYLQRSAKGDSSILVVDSRTPDWVMRGTIPGSVNIPWDKISQGQMGGMFGDAGEASTADGILIDKIGAKKTDNGWDFSDAKTLVMFCNGIWCPQSSSNIGTLIKLGYPADKLKWYRGGMQDWVSVGLTTVKP